MFSDHIRKSVTQTLNTHSRRHPLQTESIDVGDENPLLQLGRLGVAPKNARKSSESLTSGDDNCMDLDLDDGNSAKKKDSSKTGDKRKGKNPFQPVKKGKLLALRQKSVDASNILEELKSPSRSSVSDNDVWEEEHSKGEPITSVSEKPNNKVQNKMGKEKTGKINKDKFSVFGELAVNKSPKHLEKWKEKSAVDVDLIGWMKDKNEATSLGKPSAIKAEDTNKVKEKNAKFTQKKLQNERSSKRNESTIEDEIEVIEEIKIKDIVPLMLNDIQAEKGKIEKEIDHDIEKSKMNNSNEISKKSEIKMQGQEKDDVGDKCKTSPLTLKMNLEEKDSVKVNIPINQEAGGKKSTAEVVSSLHDKSEVGTGKNDLKTIPFVLSKRSSKESFSVESSKAYQNDSSTLILPQSAKKASGDGTEKMVSEDDGTPESSPSPSKGMWKTFKRADRDKKGDAAEKNETAEDKKRKFKESRSKSMAVPSVHQDEEKASLQVSSADKTGTRPKLTRSLTDIGKQDSLEELKNEMDEIMKQRAEWKKEAFKATKNKLSKMVVKTKAAWKSYEAEPGQLDYDKYYKMKEKHKEKMKEKRRVKEIETGSLDMEKFNGIDKVDEHKEKMDSAIKERERKAEEMKEKRRKQKIQREEEKKQKLTEEKEKQELAKREEEKQKLTEEGMQKQIDNVTAQSDILPIDNHQEDQIPNEDSATISKSPRKRTKDQFEAKTTSSTKPEEKLEETSVISEIVEEMKTGKGKNVDTIASEELTIENMEAAEPHEKHAGSVERTVGTVIPTDQKQPERRNNENFVDLQDESKITKRKEKKDLTELPKKNVNPKMEVDIIQDSAQVDTTQEPVRNVKQPIKEKRESFDAFAKQVTNGNDTMLGKTETVESLPEMIKDVTIVNESETSGSLSETSKENATKSRREKIRKLRQKTKEMEDKSLPLPKQFKGLPEKVNKRNEPIPFSEEVVNCIPGEEHESDELVQQKNIKIEKILAKNEENEVLSDRKVPDKTEEIKNPSLTRQERVRKLLEERKEKKENMMQERKQLEESIKRSKLSRRERINKLMGKTKENEDPSNIEKEIDDPAKVEKENEDPANVEKENEDLANVEKTPQNLIESYKEENVFKVREKSEVQVRQQDMKIGKPLANLKENNQNHVISIKKEDDEKSKIVDKGLIEGISKNLYEKDIITQHVEKVNLEKKTRMEENEKVDDLSVNERKNIEAHENKKYSITAKDEVNPNQPTSKMKRVTEAKKNTVLGKNVKETKKIDMMRKEEKTSYIPLRNAAPSNPLSPSRYLDDELHSAASMKSLENLERKFFNSPSLSKYSNEDLRCIGPAMTLKGSIEETDMKKRFFRASGDPYSFSKSEILESYNSSDDRAVSKEEWKCNVIDKICNRVGEASPAYLDTRDETWNLLAAGEQVCGKNVPGKMDMESTVVELKKSMMDNTMKDDEAWILIARGVKRRSIHDEVQDDEEDEKEETWFSIAQGSELSDQKENRLRKLSQWSKRHDMIEKHSWDMDNMPIQTDEFIHFDRKQKEFFETKML